MDNLYIKRDNPLDFGFFLIYFRIFKLTLPKLKAGYASSEVFGGFYTGAQLIHSLS